MITNHVYIHAQDIQITKSNLFDSLITLNNALSQMWMLLLLRSVLLPFMQATMGNHGHIYLGNNHAYSIKGIGTMHLSVDDTNELVLHDVRYHVPSNNKSLLFVGQMDIQRYSTCPL